MRVVDEPQQGLTFARQAGFAASTGELIANVDSDSRLTPGWVRTVLTKFAAEPKLVALSGPFIYYDMSSSQRVSVQLFYAIAFMVYALNRYVLRAGSMVQGGNFVLRRDGAGGDRRLQHGDRVLRRRHRHRAADEPGGRGEVHLRAEDVLVGAAAEEGRDASIALRYTINYFWTIFRKTPYTKEYTDIREQADADSAVAEHKG